MINTVKLFKIIRHYNILYIIISNNFEIPKHIYQTFETWENIPETFKKRIKITRTINKNYEYHFYDNKNCEKYILETYGKDIFDIYNSISKDYNAARADLFRYLIIYDKGGIYFDIKSYPVKPLDQIITPTDKLLLSSWFYKYWEQYLHTGYGEFQNWFVIAKPRHTYIKNVIKLIINKILHSNKNQYREKKGVLWLTGPITYTQGMISLLKSKEYTFKPNSYGKMFSYNGIKTPELGEPPSRNFWNAHIKEYKNHHYTNARGDIINHDKIIHLKNEKKYNLIIKQLDLL